MAVANPVIELNTTAAVETKHEKDHNSPAAGLREAGIKTGSEEVDTKFEAEDTVAPDEYEVHTEIDEESTEDSLATEFDEMNETNLLRAVLYHCMRQDRTLLACNVSQRRQAGIKTESREEIDTEFEAEDAVTPEKTKYKYEPKTEVDEKPVSRKKGKRAKSDDCSGSNRPILSLGSCVGIINCLFWRRPMLLSKRPVFQKRSKSTERRLLAKMPELLHRSTGERGQKREERCRRTGHCVNRIHFLLGLCVNRIHFLFERQKK